MDTTHTPASQRETRDAVAAITEAIAAHRHRPGALLPTLHAVQETLGCIPANAVAEIARALGLSRAEVDGVVAFYDDFTPTPAGRHRIRICVAEACLACGAQSVIDSARTAFDCPPHRTRPDGAVTMETVHCLGLCASGPAIEVDGRALGRISPARIAEIAGSLGLER